MDINIDLGIEMKIVYDKKANPLAEVLLVFNTEEASGSFSLQLYNGMCTFLNCATQEINMNTVQDRISFILKIYRKDGKLMIDLDGENKLEMDINFPNNLQQGCPSFWGTDIKELQFLSDPENVLKYYRMVTADDETDEGDKDDEQKGKLHW